MILDDFLSRLNYEYHTLDTLTVDDYYPRLSSLFVLLELDGERLNAEHQLEIDELLEKFSDINEDELHNGLSAMQLNSLVSKIKAGLALLIGSIEA